MNLDQILQMIYPQGAHEISKRLRTAANAIMRPGVPLGQRGLSTRYEVICLGPDGREKWRDLFHNLVVNEGLDDSLDKHLEGSAYTAAWYVGLTAGTPTPAAGDTMASHAGWTEVTAYTEGTRPAAVWGVVSGQSVDNSASTADFSINANGTVIGGAFLVTSAVKGGAAGILYGIGAFSAGNKTLDSGDTLQVTVTATAAAV